MSLADRARVAVIIVTWNSASVVEGLLRSVSESVFDGTVRLIAVDNASDDRTLELIHDVLPDADVIQMGRNAGYAAAMNAGIALARDCDSFLLLNPDIRLDRNALQAMHDEMRESGAGIVVPQLVDEFGTLRLSLRREPTVLRAWGEALLGGRRAGRYPPFGEVDMRADTYARPAQADWATGAAMLISQGCSARVGKWDESFFLYSEETDFALRARDAGFVLRYTPRAVAVHFEGESHESAALFSLLVRNRVKLFRSRHGMIRTSAFWSGVFIGELIRARRPTRRAAVWALLGRTGRVARPTP
jgi:N-acetylglucosaminyl-diphospho-decaprenol L-rhamnosyltransferase